ncbi:MAG: hypothetical protein LAT65_17815, partial [Saccharospirillum sp.]|nr:hypothetical protein [Saccharospirillum sp.]
AHSSPTPGLTVCSYSCGRAFATRFFQADLTASPLRFATVVVTNSGYILSGNKFWTMPGTRVRSMDAAIQAPWTDSRRPRRGTTGSRRGPLPPNQTLDLSYFQ